MNRRLHTHTLTASMAVVLAALVLLPAGAAASPPAQAAASATTGLAVTTGPTSTTLPGKAGGAATSASSSTTSTTLSERDRMQRQLPPPFGTGPSFWDIGGRIRQAINGWFYDLVARNLGPLLDLVATTVLATPNLTAATSRVRELWWVSDGIANTAMVLLVTIGGVIVMTHETLQTSYGVKEIAPRLVVAMLAANLSLLLVGYGIQLTNALAVALLGGGIDPQHVRATLRTLALGPLQAGSALGFLSLLALVLVVMAVGLVATYVVRVALLITLTAAAPLALVCHALPKLDGLAQLWWRAVAGCFGIQLGQALVLAMAVRVFFEADRARVLGLGGGHLVDLVVVGCLLWMLLRLPVWVSRLVFGRRGSTVVRMVRSYVIYRGIRSFGAGLGSGG